ncbi:MAG TPA: cytochrome c biogenesis protein DipZ [Solirubrobacteraceae bacterium]|nr:cytochrome c biogenesis protein DipZ [Solirubrobacteraceae bacterium]
MVALTVFALIAGAATALSPCVLPVLPVALAAGATGGPRRPLGVVTGLALSFTFATVALVYLISALGLPDDLLRRLAIAVLIVFGLALIVPPAAARIEAGLSRLVRRRPAAPGDGFRSGVIVGIGLGFVYAPCAGPILAGVITVSASQPFTAGRLVVALAYGAGSAAALYALLLGGRRLTSRLARRSGAFQIAMGTVMVLVAVAMFANLDTRFETSIATKLPSFLVNPTDRLERTQAAQHGLRELRGRTAGSAFAAAASAGGRGTPSSLPVLGRAPGFGGTQQWFNTPSDRPLTLAELRGRVVLVDFWTYSCINCLRTLPYLKAWDAKYRAKGLTIVGVHTPEFPFERSAANVRAAIAQNGLHYPVVQDNEDAVWNAYGNEYWPAEYLIDTRGRVRFAAFGEGDDARKEQAIRSLLAERGASRLGGLAHPRAQAASAGESTPESYLGAARAERFVGVQPRTGTRDFGPLAAEPPSLSHLRYAGRWTIRDDSATAGPGAALQLRFQARRVFLVLGAPGRTRTVRVLLDGRPVTAAAGSDVHDGRARVGFQRLYRLIDLPRVETHTLTVEPQPGTSAYAFTFG